MAEIDARRNEILGQSATIIQKQIRTFFFRRWFKQMRGSAIQVQALCRGTAMFALIHQVIKTTTLEYVWKLSL